jgi:DNA (cytosine-5)-methyltransferase 1
MKPLKIGSLFSGVGGLELGLQWGFNDLGIQSEVAWHVEMGEYPSRVLQARFPDARHCDDVFKVDDTFERVDLLCGGFPCQPISSAGQQQGSEDDRFLWPEFARIAREMQPAMVVFENVGNLLKIEDGAVFNLVVSDLHRAGYDVSWRMFSAADMGAPHVRPRVFGLAWRRDHVPDEAAHQPSNGALPFDESSWRDNRWRKHAPILSDPPEYQRERAKCLGNAVVPACARRIGRVAGAIWRGDLPAHSGDSAPHGRMAANGSWEPSGASALFGNAEPGPSPTWTEQGSVMGGAHRITCPWGIDEGARPSLTYPTPAVWAGGIDRPNVILDALEGRIPAHQLQLEDRAMLEHLRALDPMPEDMTAAYREIRSTKRINPEFVEGMMGFPRGWTAL